MDAQERILTTINHEEPDRVPAFESAFTNNTIMKHYGVDPNKGRGYKGGYEFSRRVGIDLVVSIASLFPRTFLKGKRFIDEYGRIMSINNLKHFRLVLWLTSYFLFIGIVYLSSNIAFAFLPGQLFAKLLFAIFTVLFALSPIVVILIVLSFFVTFFHDKQFQNLLNRGIFPGEQL